jgi:hypothetical protein
MFSRAILAFGQKQENFPAAIKATAEYFQKRKTIFNWNF